ncbi:MAG: TetR/AcrR family transcriptional regulator [Thermoleophilia bacterium]|nr:TetR/AcrR family transcriptional regulator [Thermoleophilia bacterium]
MTAVQRPANRGRGRPRSTEHDDAILDAAVSLMREVGYARMSMEAVAAAAGVSKPTLYLRYAGKAELVVAAHERVRVGDAPAPTGDLRADLVAQLRHLHDVFARLGMSVIGVCLTEEESLPDLIAALRARSLEPGRQMMRDAIARAVHQGALSDGADAETAIEMAIGAYYARYLAGRPFDQGWPERVADATLRALGAPPA